MLSAKKELVERQQLLFARKVEGIDFVCGTDLFDFIDDEDETHIFLQVC